jgi:hypothetical protein
MSDENLERCKSKQGISSFDKLLLIGLLLLVFQILGPILTIPLHIPVNYNEGWNAIFDARAVTPGAGPLYPPSDSFVFNNYPPLGFYLVGAVGRYVFGDMIVAGRVVALFSLLSAAGLISFCVCRLGGERRAGMAVGLLLLLYINSYFKKYVAVDDPQWLAHAMMLAGVAVLLGGRDVGQPGAGSLPTARLVAGALLMVAGGFVKHNLVALPLAVTLWLVCLNRRAAMIWTAAGLIGLGAGLGVTAALHGRAAYDDILFHRRVFRVGLIKHCFTDLAPLLPMAVAAMLLLYLTRRRERVARRASALFVGLFAAIALVTGIIQRMGEGVYYNAQFETLIAVCLGFGLALSPVVVTPIRWRRLVVGPAALCCVAALPLICAWPWHLPRAWDDIHDRAARAEAWQPMIAQIAAVKGPVGCLMISLCWWAGKQSEIDAFNLSEKSVLAGDPPAAFRAAVARQHFAMFQDDPKSFIHNDAVQRLGFDPVMTLFAKGYAPVGHGPDGTVLLAPIGGDRRKSRLGGVSASWYP